MCIILQMTTQISSLWSFSDKVSAQLTCLSKIGWEIQLFLSTTKVAVQQLAVAELWAAWMQQIERELQYKCGSGGDSVIGSSTEWQQQCRVEWQ